jgi:ubiquitin-conjugating enzyme E2 O
LTALGKANWLHISKELKSAQQNPKPGKMVTVTVEKVQVESVNVHWQCKAYSKDGSCGEKEQPKQLVFGDDLKRYN